VLKFIASMFVAALLSLSHTFASAQCFPLEKVVQYAPQGLKETSRITGEVLAKWKALMAARWLPGSDKITPEADTVVFLRINEEKTAIAVGRDGCTLGTGIVKTELVPPSEAPSAPPVPQFQSGPKVNHPAVPDDGKI
jgi:hypothetical protein